MGWPDRNRDIGLEFGIGRTKPEHLKKGRGLPPPKPPARPDFGNGFFGGGPPGVSLRCHVEDGRFAGGPPGGSLRCHVGDGPETEHNQRPICPPKAARRSHEKGSLPTLTHHVATALRAANAKAAGTWCLKCGNVAWPAPQDGSNQQSPSTRGTEERIVSPPRCHQMTPRKPGYLTAVWRNFWFVLTGP